MPYESLAQEGYFHAHKAELEKQGVNVGEWDAATKGKHLPQHKAKGGLVKPGGNSELPEALDKGKAASFHPHTPIGGVNNGHGMFATGGAVGAGDTRWTKKDPQGQGRDGRFLSTQDRFTGGRKPAGYPEEAETAEDWVKPPGVGHTEADDQGDTKSLSPVKPRK